MEIATGRLPPTYSHLALGDIDSTNAEALRRAQAGHPGHLWITADRQLAGKGRAGRSWASEPGNLYATLLLRPAVRPGAQMQLPLVAGLAVHDAVWRAWPAAVEAGLGLKWPNDLLLGPAKLAGILIEATSAYDDSNAVVAIGCGINLARHPDDLDRPATSLAAEGVATEPANLFPCLAAAMTDWLGVWNGGVGLPLVRRSWLARATGLGREITVKAGGSKQRGTFLGLDDDGALRLLVDGVSERRITFGDVVLHSR